MQMLGPGNHTSLSQAVNWKGGAYCENCGPQSSALLVGKNQMCLSHSHAHAACGVLLVFSGHRAPFLPTFQSPRPHFPNSLISQWSFGK